MIRTICISLLVVCVSLLTSCNTPDASERDLPAYHSKVEAFSSGNISRYSSVYLMFNTDIPKELLKDAQLEKRMRIKPEVKGKWSFDNARTVVFKPEQALDQHTTYRVTADVSKWFEVKGKEKEFSFSFTTLPLLLRAHLSALKVNEKNENGYDVHAEILTADRERPEVVEELVNFSEKVQAEWQIGRAHV